MKQYQLLDVVLQNYCELIKLQSASKKLDIHKELMHKNKRFLINHVTFDVKKFRNMYQYIERLDEKTKNDYRRDLLKDMKIIEENLIRREDLDSAAYELITKQQGKINELCQGIEKKAKILETIRDQNARKFVKTEYDHGIMYFSSTHSGVFDVPKYPSSHKGSISMIERGSVGRSSSKERDTSEILNGSLTQTKPVSTVRRIHKSRAELQLSASENKPRTSFKKISPVKRASPDKDSVSRTFSPLTSLSPHRNYSPTRGTSPVKSASSLSHTQKSPGKEKMKSILSASRHKKLKKPTEEILATIGKISPKNKYDLINSYQSSVLYSDQRGTLTGSPKRDSFRSFNQSPHESVKPTQFQLPAEKDRIISNLTKTLKQKTEEILIVEDQNKQLAEKLQKIQETSGLASKIAKEEYLMLQKELQRTEDIKISLNEEIAHLQSNLDQVISKANNLELENRSLREDSLRAKQYAQELAMWKTIDDKIDIAERYNADKVVQKVFHLLQRAVGKSKEIAKIEKKNVANTNKKRMLLCFRYLQRRTLLSKIIKVKDLERQRRLCEDVFFTWTANARFSKRYQHLVGERNENLLASAMKAWKNYTSAKIDQRYQEFLLKTSLLAFKQNYRLYNHSAVDLKKKEKQAASYYRQRQKKMFFAIWQHCVYHQLVPKRQKLEQAASLYMKNLLKTGLRIFQENLKFYRNAEKRAEELFQKCEMKTLDLHFGAWKRNFMDLVNFKKNLNHLEDKYNLNRRWNMWREAYKSSQMMQKKMQLAIAHHRLSLTKRMFTSWSTYQNALKKRMAQFDEYEAHRMEIERKLAFKAWREALTKKRQEKAKAENSRIKKLAKLFAGWIQANAYIKAKKGRARRALNFRQQKIAELKANIFNIFKEKRANAKRLAAVEKTIAQRQKFSLCRFYFEVIAGEAKNTLRNKLAQMTKERDAALAKAQEHLENANKIDEDRLELIEKMEILSKSLDEVQHENAHNFHKLEIAEAEITERRNKEEITASEVRMKDDAIKKLTLSLEEARQMIQNRDEEIEKLMNQNRETRVSLEERIESLEVETEDKQRKIHELEALLASWIERGQEMKALEIKFSQSSTENSDLKQELASRESELQELNKSNVDLSGKVEELRAQLKKALDSMVEASQRYEVKISDLNAKIEQLEREKIDLTHMNKQYQEEFIELKSIANKYEYEVGLLTAQQQNSIQEFIVSLRKAKQTSGSPLRKKYEEEHLSYREGKGTAEASHRLHNLLSQRSFDYAPQRRNSDFLNKSIQELNAFLAFENSQEERKTLSRRASPEPRHKRERDILPQPRETQRLREDKPPLKATQQTQFEKAQSPKASPPKNAEKKEPRGTATNISVESIQRE